MIKMPIAYEDFDGNSLVEDFHFNMTKLELMEMEIHHEGGLQSYIERLTKTTAGPEAYDLFKEVVLASYGEKSSDGKRFIKRDELTGAPLRYRFEHSPAMAEMIFSFLEDGEKGAAWVQGIMPASLVKEVEKEVSSGAVSETVTDGAVQLSNSTSVVEVKKDWREFSEAELLEMSDSDFYKVAGSDKPKDWDRELLILAAKRKSTKG